MHTFYSYRSITFTRFFNSSVNGKNYMTFLAANHTFNSNNWFGRALAINQDHYLTKCNFLRDKEQNRTTHKTRKEYATVNNGRY